MGTSPNDINPEILAELLNPSNVEEGCHFSPVNPERQGASTLVAEELQTCMSENGYDMTAKPAFTCAATAENTISIDMGLTS